ncbi:hypothetical protein [Pseudomonas sp. TE3610]
MAHLHEKVTVETRLARIANYQLSVKGVEDEVDTSAAVVGNSVLSFVTGIDSERKQDAMNTYLLATKVADKAVKSGQGEDWYAKFRQVMKDCGWVEINNTYRQHSSKKQQFTMEEVAVEILKGAVVTAAMSGVTAITAVDGARKAIEALAKKEGPLNVFERHVRSDRGGSFGLGSAVQTPEGDVILALGTVHYASQTNATSVLFSNWDSGSVEIYQGATSFVMNPMLIAATRATVAAKLVGKAASAIAEYDID